VVEGGADPGDPFDVGEFAVIAVDAFDLAEADGVLGLEPEGDGFEDGREWELAGLAWRIGEGVAAGVGDAGDLAGKADGRLE
jgi:hypothetical protein